MNNILQKYECIQFDIYIYKYIYIYIYIQFLSFVWIRTNSENMIFHTCDNYLYSFTA